MREFETELEVQVAFLGYARLKKGAVPISPKGAKSKIHHRSIIHGLYILQKLMGCISSLE